jgi:uncharacterized protein YabE (DUF348 family)
MTRKMNKRSLELLEFDIKFEERNALKAQVLAGFIAKMTISSFQKKKITISLEEKTNRI